MTFSRATHSQVSIRTAEASDFRRIYEIFQRVVKTGDTFANDPDTTYEQAKDYWMGPGVRTYIALVDGRIEGSYILKPNHPGLGSHVANAGFIVDPLTTARGVGTQMGQHALAQAKALGYQAMQFNFVVSTNERAVALWKRLGFAIIGVSPKAFQHQRLGLVDTYIMHRFLE